MRRSALLAVFLFAVLALSAQAGEVVVNGGFETGDFTAWVHGAYRGGNNDPNLADHSVEPDLPYKGSYSALLGFKYTPQTTDARGYMYQTVMIPPNVSSAVLNFKIRMQGYDSDFYDPFYADIRSTGNGLLRRVLSYAFSEWNNIYKDSGWLDDDNVLPISHDVGAFAGQTVRLYFEQTNRLDALYETWTYVDDVSLVYRMWADLAVDGDGDDVFGGFGSGNGGESMRSALASEAIYYDLRLENESTVSDSYQLTATLPSGWTAELEVGGSLVPFPYTTPSLVQGQVETYRVRVQVPAGASPGVYDSIVDAQSTAQSSRLDSVRLRTTVSPAVYASDLVIDGNGVGVIGDGGAGGFGLKNSTWGMPVSFALELRNTGNIASSYTVAFSGDSGLDATVDDGSTVHSSSFSTPSIPAGSNVTLTLELSVPSPNPGDDYELVLSATSDGDPNKRDSVLSIVRLLAPLVDMLIAANGDGIYGASGTGGGGGSSNAGERGAIVNFPITVQNESAAPDSFQLSWSPPGGGWTGSIAIGGVNRSFPTVTPTIPANSQAFYTLRVTIPDGAAYGTYMSILDAASQVSPLVTESVSATVSVATPSEVDILVDGAGADIYGPIGTGLGGTSIQTASPGDTLFYQVEIQNVSGQNGFDVDWVEPSGWDVSFNGGYVPLIDIPAGSYPLRVIVPSSSTGGTFDVIFDGRKNDKPFLLDSITARVVVIPPAAVDGLIDGNGDGVIAALGSGGGGLSQQTTPTPSTMNFTIELQNQGPSGDSYVVQWNAIPAWSAQLDGQPSPYNTGIIPAGGSRIYTFTVVVPAGETVAVYDYILDVLSQNNAGSRESLTARVNVVGPPRPDYTIDGLGAGVYGSAGSGQGGSSTRAALPGSAYTAALELRNAGSFPDSFQIFWNQPAGWPISSVTVADSTVTHSSSFWSPRLAPDEVIQYTVNVNVPPSANGTHTALLNAISSLPPSLSESVALVTETRALLRGRVFDDRDHDSLFGPGDIGLGGVVVRENRSGLSAATGADGSYSLLVPADSLSVEEFNPPGFVSLSPDLVSVSAVAAGDTATVDFADVGILTLSGGGGASAAAGNNVDFPHRLQARTASAVTLSATPDSSYSTVWLVDLNANGMVDPGDRSLLPADLDLDPGGPSGGILDLLLRVFIPAGASPGATMSIDIEAEQAVSGTPLVLNASTTDVVVVSAGSIGQLDMQKSHDRTDAAPGDLITYTIRLFNAGTDSLAQVVVVDPVSPWVDPEPDAFGAGNDLQWQPPSGGTQYLSFDPGDSDEAEYTTADRTLRVTLSKNSTFFLAPGEEGFLSYRVRVR